MAGEGRPRFQELLNELELSMLGGIDLVLGQIDRTIDALERQDVELASFIAADDDRIDGRYLEVHQGALSLLALQAPVAGDLRVIAAILHIIKNIERMGDQCTNIAKVIPLSGHEPSTQDDIRTTILHMGRAARAQTALSKRAWAERDVELAEDLRRQDREINRLNRDVFAMAVRAGADEDVREWAMTMTMAARAYERIGDNAVDIGEQTAFVVTGLFREFTDSAA